MEGIKKQILNLVGNYDGIITDIDVLTRKDDTVISDATYMSDDEKTKAKANLGLFLGDLSLQQLKSSMQQVMMNPYPTSLGRELSLLAQIGISTDTRSPGSASIDRTRLRGYLEVDEPKLTAADRPARRSDEAALRQRYHGRSGRRQRGGVPARHPPAALRADGGHPSPARNDAR